MFAIGIALSMAIAIPFASWCSNQFSRIGETQPWLENLGETIRLSRLHWHSDKIFSVIFFSFPQLVAGWKRETSSARVERGPSQAARSASTEVPLRPARLTRLHQATMFQLLFLSHSQAGMEEQPSTARVEGAAFPISSRAGFLVGLGQFEERIRPEHALKSLRAGEPLEDGRLFDEVLGCAHAGYHGKSPWRNDQAR